MNIDIGAKAYQEADLYDKDGLFETPQEKKGFIDGFGTGYLASLTDIRNGLVDLNYIKQLLEDGHRNTTKDWQKENQLTNLAVQVCGLKKILIGAEDDPILGPQIRQRVADLEKQIEDLKGQ